MIGELISKYRLLAPIGEGSMGAVYKAQDVYLGRFAAVKLLAPKYAEDAEMAARFEREAAALAALLHPNICTVFESGRWQGRPFMAMELLEGETLQQRMARGKLEPAEAMQIASGVLSG